MKGLALLLAFIVVWDVGWLFAGVNQMLPWQLKSRLRDSPESVRLIDVRTKAEYDLFHIPGAQHQPDLLTHPENLDQPEHPDAVTVVICMTGHRSPLAAKQLETPRVYNLTWGMLGWLIAFGPVTRN